MQYNPTVSTITLENAMTSIIRKSVLIIAGALAVVGLTASIAVAAGPGTGIPVPPGGVTYGGHNAQVDHQCVDIMSVGDNAGYPSAWDMNNQRYTLMPSAANLTTGAYRITVIDPLPQYGPEVIAAQPVQSCSVSFWVLNEFSYRTLS